MRNRFIYIFLLLILSLNIFANNYYIDAANGNDANSGLKPKNAWKTLVKANSVKWARTSKILSVMGNSTLNGLNDNTVRFSDYALKPQI